MNQLTKQTITIDLDAETGEFRLEFTGCKFLDVYRVVKNLTERFESGDIFEHELTITDLRTGEPSDPDELRSLIQTAKEEIESKRNT